MVLILDNYQVYIRPLVNNTIIYVKLVNSDKIYGSTVLYGEACNKIVIASYKDNLFIVNGIKHAYLYQINNKDASIKFKKVYEYHIYSTLPLIGYGSILWGNTGYGDAKMYRFGIHNFSKLDNDDIIECYSFCSIQKDKFFIVNKTGFELYTIVSDDNKVVSHKRFDHDGYKEEKSSGPITCCKISDDFVMLVYEYHGDRFSSDFKNKVVNIQEYTNIAKIKIINVNTFKMVGEYYFTTFTTFCNYLYHPNRSILEFISEKGCPQFYLDKTNWTFTKVDATFCAQDVNGNDNNSGSCVTFPASRNQKELIRQQNLLGNLFGSLPRVIIDIIIEYALLLY